MEKNYIDVKKERRDRYDKKANKKVSKKDLKEWTLRAKEKWNNN